MPTDTFDYTGADQTFVVPPDVTAITVACYGAQGGGGGTGGILGGFGLGGSIQCRLPVTPGETLHVFVGGTPSALGVGGFNGGGTAGNGGGGGGGGASDVRQGGSAVTDRVVVAGGGAGAGKGVNGASVAISVQGGAGSGANGTDGADGDVTPGSNPTGGDGGTSSAGGAGGTPSSSGGVTGETGDTDGTGQGGDTGSFASSGGAGGGGWHGGGGGASSFGGFAPDLSGAGGGGSGHGTGIAQTTGTGVQSGDGQVIFTYTEGCDCTCGMVAWKNPVEVEAIIAEVYEAFGHNPNLTTFLDRIEPLIEQRDRVLERHVSRLCYSLSDLENACECHTVDWRYPVEIQALIAEAREAFGSGSHLIGFLDKVVPLFEQRDRVLEDHVSRVCQAPDDDACTATAATFRQPVEVQALIQEAREAFGSRRAQEFLNRIEPLLEQRDRTLEAHLSTLATGFIDSP